MNGTNKISDDAHLVKRLHNDDIFAFNELYQKYSAKAYNFIIKHLDTEEDTKDLLQELFLTIWNKRKDINEDLSFNSYLFTITLNLIRKHFRKKVKDRNIIHNWTETTVHYSQDSSYLTETHNLELISNKIISELPPKRKQVFELSRKKGLSNEEIAEKLNITKKTVENHLNLALKYFRKKYKSRSFLLSLFFILYL
jgi:RNA polymerase sigma-70 factor (ECF subfamily)